MTQVRAGLAVSMLSLCLAAPVCAAETVEIFRLSRQPEIAGAAGSIIYTVDALNLHMQRLSAGLPADPAAASTIAAERLKALSREEQQALRLASTAQVRATEYQITKTPAIVFDGRAVVYGLYDVEQARRIYQAWRANGGQ